MLYDFAASALATLMVTLDPPALAPIFLSVTRGMTKAERWQTGLRACIIAFFILTVFGLGGEFILGLLGIGLPAFRIAGGILLFRIAFEMVFEQRNDRKQATADQAITKDHIQNVAAFPLAIPLMAGPGAITATILLAGRAQGDIVSLAVLVALIAFCVGTCLLVFYAAERISGWLGVTGNIVLSRLLGVILAGLAVQFVINGVVILLATKL